MSHFSFFQQNFTVKVADVNEPISSVTAEWKETGGVLESTAIGQILGQVLITDPDQTDKISCENGDLVALKCRDLLRCRSFDIVLARNLDYETMGKSVDISLNCSDGRIVKQKVSCSFSLCAVYPLKFSCNIFADRPTHPVGRQ